MLTLSSLRTQSHLLLSTQLGLLVGACDPPSPEDNLENLELKACME